MQPLYTEAEFQSAKSRQLLPLKCLHCDRTFHRAKHRIQEARHPKRSESYDFCSCSCQRRYNEPLVDLDCEQCGKSFKKLPSQVRVTRHHFCSQSCAGKYSNVHRVKGTRISKLEIWLSKKLPHLYPSLEFHFNRKDAINGELDIFIPSLKLAFELNGIFHYEPIYSSEKLASIQTNDQRKFQACIEHGIELCVIDVSHQKYFKEQSSLKFLDIIKNIMKSKLAGHAEIESATQA